MTITLKERFWSKVLVGDGCWEWQGGKYDSGYGTIRTDKKFVLPNGVHKTIRKSDRAHRVSYYLHHNIDLPDDICVLHTCDNRLCVRPDHLFIGDRADNCADKVSKGRQAKGDMIGVLTDEQVTEIRVMKESGQCTQRHIARKFDVSESLVSMIVNNIHRKN